MTAGGCGQAATSGGGGGGARKIYVPSLGETAASGTSPESNDGARPPQTSEDTETRFRVLLTFNFIITINPVIPSDLLLLEILTFTFELQLLNMREEPDQRDQSQAVVGAELRLLTCSSVSDLQIS